MDLDRTDRIPVGKDALNLFPWAFFESGGDDNDRSVGYPAAAYIGVSPSVGEYFRNARERGLEMLVSHRHNLRYAAKRIELFNPFLQRAQNLLDSFWPQAIFRIPGVRCLHAYVPLLIKMLPVIHQRPLLARH